MVRYPALLRPHGDNNFNATFPDVPELSASGSSLEAVILAAQSALQAHLDSAASLAEPFSVATDAAEGEMLVLIEAKPVGKLVELTLSLDARMMARIEKVMADQGFASHDVYFTHIAQLAMQPRPAAPRAASGEGERRDSKPREFREKREDYATREPRAASNYFRNDGGERNSGSFKPRRDDESPRNPRRARPESGEGAPRREYRPRDEASASDRPRREYKPRVDSMSEERQRSPYKPRGESSAGDERPRKAYGEKKTYGDKKPYGEKKTYGEKKSYGDKKPYGEKKSFGSRKPAAPTRDYGTRGPAAKPRAPRRDD